MIGSLSALFFLFSSLLMHPVHETVCEVQWNPKTKRVEVALRLDAMDEQWIEKRNANPNPDTQPDTDTDWHARFLASRIQFDPVRDKRLKSRVTGRPIKWVGRKEDGGHVYWFFEVVCDDGKPPESVQTRLLFDRDSSYQHRIIVLGPEGPEGVKNHSMLLSERKPKAPLRWIK